MKCHVFMLVEEVDPEVVSEKELLGGPYLATDMNYALLFLKDKYELEFDEDGHCTSYEALAKEVMKKYKEEDYIRQDGKYIDTLKNNIKKRLDESHIKPFETFNLKKRFLRRMLILTLPITDEKIPYKFYKYDHKIEGDNYGKEIDKENLIH